MRAVKNEEAVDRRISGVSGSVAPATEPRSGVFGIEPVDGGRRFHVPMFSRPHARRIKTFALSLKPSVGPEETGRLRWASTPSPRFSMVLPTRRGPDPPKFKAVAAREAIASASRLPSPGTARDPP